MIVAEGGEVELLRQPHDLRVLGDYHHIGKALRWHGFQGPEDQAPAPKLGRQLVFPEPGGVSRRHHYTAKFHQS